MTVFHAEDGQNIKVHNNTWFFQDSLIRCSEGMITRLPTKGDTGVCSNDGQI